MATPLGHEAMIEALEHTPLGIQVDDSATALDLAIQLWLKDRRLLERLHAEQKLQRTRTFEYFQAPARLDAHRSRCRIAMVSAGSKRTWIAGS